MTEYTVIQENKEGKTLMTCVSVCEGSEDKELDFNYLHHGYKVDACVCKTDYIWDPIEEKCKHATNG
jgi:hypothetical protein